MILPALEDEALVDVVFFAEVLVVEDLVEDAFFAALMPAIVALSTAELFLEVDFFDVDFFVVVFFVVVLPGRGMPAMEVNAVWDTTVYIAPTNEPDWYTAVKPLDNGASA